MTHSRYDILTDINLKYIKENGNHFTYYRFINENGDSLDDELSNDIDSKLLVEYMYSKNLITYPSSGDICNVIKDGLEILNIGGWLVHLENESQEELITIEKENERQNLKDKIDEFKLEELEYKKTIRKLEEELKISSLIKNYWWLIGSAIGIGVTIGKFLI